MSFHSELVFPILPTSPQARVWHPAQQGVSYKSEEGMKKKDCPPTQTSKSERSNNEQSNADIFFKVALVKDSNSNPRWLRTDLWQLQSKSGIFDGNSQLNDPEVGITKCFAVVSRLRRSKCCLKVFQLCHVMRARLEPVIWPLSPLLLLASLLSLAQLPRGN